VRGTVPKMAAHREVVGVPFALLYQIKGFIHEDFSLIQLFYFAFIRHYVLKDNELRPIFTSFVFLRWV